MKFCVRMTNSTLFVFDTNTLVSALLFANSTPALAFQKAQKNGFFVCSDETFAELSDVLMRPKFDRYLSQGSRQLFLEAYERSAGRLSVSVSRPAGISTTINFWK